MFLSQLYGGMDEPEAKIIDVLICKLRKKLATASEGKDYIETVLGRGYVMREQARLRRGFLPNNFQFYSAGNAVPLPLTLLGRADEVIE
jgi:hypothetical protein